MSTVKSGRVSTKEEEGEGEGISLRSMQRIERVSICCGGCCGGGRLLPAAVESVSSAMIIGVS